MLRFYQKLGARLARGTRWLWLAGLVCAGAAVTLVLATTGQKSILLAVLFTAIGLLSFGLAGLSVFFSRLDFEPVAKEGLRTRIKKKLLKCYAWLLALVLSVILLMLVKLVIGVFRQFL